MAASITSPTEGIIPCTFLHGPPPGVLKERVSIWSLPGLDGYGAQRLGLGNAPFTFTAVLYSSLDDVVAWLIRIASTQSHIVGVVDDRNKSHSNLLIRLVEEPDIIPAISHVGTFRGEVQLSGVTLQAA